MNKTTPVNSSTYPPSGNGLAIYLQRNLQVCIYMLGELIRTPFSSMMTAAVIGIALALPMGLHVALQNVQKVTQGWNTTAQISLFLKQNVSTEQAKKLAQKLRTWKEINDVTFIHKDEALDQFRKYSGFGEAMEALDENPLPSVLVLYPSNSFNRPEAIEAMLGRFRALNEVDLAQLDMQWIKRLYGIMDIGYRAIYILSFLLALSVVLIVGNTIRLAIENKRDEIEIIKLIGGTNSFIRRPFLYTGIWLGLAGGLIAWILIGLSLWALSEPVSRLATLYESGFELTHLDIQASFLLLAIGSGLGLTGSWLAVGRHLSAIEPN